MDNFTARARVLIVEDHEIVLDGLVDLLSRQRDLEVCGTARSIAQALAAARELAPNVVVLDLTLGDDDGLELIAPLRSELPGTPILVLSMHDELLYAERMIALGVRGYISKEQASDELLRAIREVLRGLIYVSPRVSERIVKRVANGRGAGVVVPEQVLSPREIEVFRMLGEGRDLATIATTLGMGIKTADTHRRNIRSKLGLGSSAELLRYAMHWSRRMPEHKAGEP